MTEASRQLSLHHRAVHAPCGSLSGMQTTVRTMSSDVKTVICLEHVKYFVSCEARSLGFGKHAARSACNMACKLAECH